MEIKASLKNLRVSPRKVRLLTDGWRGKHPEEVFAKLSLQPYKSVEPLVKLIKQAIANAVNVYKLDKTGLRVDSIQVGDAFTYKRMDHSHGARFDRGMIKKRGSNVYLVIVSSESKQEKANVLLESKNQIVSEKKTVKKIVKKDGSKS